MSTDSTTILYTVIASIHDPSCEEDWRRWMLSEHMGEVQQAGAKCAYLVKEDDSSRYHCMYEFASKEVFDRYLQHHAPQLRAAGAEKFSTDQVSYTRTTGRLYSPAN